MGTLSPNNLDPALPSWKGAFVRSIKGGKVGRSGVMDDSQGSACRATLGWMIERRWRSVGVHWSLDIV